METEHYKKDKEIYEKQMKLEKDLSRESEDEYNTDHIEYFSIFHR